MLKKMDIRATKEWSLDLKLNQNKRIISEKRIIGTQTERTTLSVALLLLMMRLYHQQLLRSSRKSNLW